MKVYIVTQGNYSDYHICAIYLDRKKAEEYITKGNLNEDRWYDYMIEEWETDTPIPEDCIWIRMFKDGSLNGEPRIEHFTKSGFITFDAQGSMLWSVQTDDTKTAIKVTNEKRLAVLALGLWGNEDMVNNMIK